jgi:mono/diheme cytochrome c family protein
MKSELNDLYTDTSTAGIGYGKLFFYKNCSACHGPRDGYKNAPTTFDLNKFDSLELQNKLKNIKSDSVHKHFIEPIEYSDKEIISIREFIKDYFNPRY